MFELTPKSLCTLNNQSTTSSSVGQKMRAPSKREIKALEKQHLGEVAKSTTTGGKKRGRKPKALL